ncbi:hypothetical protein DL93DRAFT_312839 [Clavulina sp. PMI_390]|nr:hypothetical protein DL93DRAFT_312839 [Clavulina sp. PMI_390]
MLSRSFLFCFIFVVNLVTAAELDFQWPNYPEENVNFQLTWSGGTAPYTVYVLTSDQSKYYYKYTGSALSTQYDFALDVGTEVVMQCIDSAGLKVTSPTISVIASVAIEYPTGPQVGVSSSIQWSGGWAPYTAYVLSTDESTYYWKYTGSSLIQYWTPSVAAGTQVLFQVVDSNGVTATSSIITVGDNGASVSQQSLLSTASLASVASQSSPTAQSTQPSTTASNPTTTTASPSKTTSGTVGGSATAHTSSGQPTQTSGGSGGKSSPNVGAIAGGVAGGVLGLALLGLIGVWIARTGLCGGKRAADDTDLENGAHEKGEGAAVITGGHVDGVIQRSLTGTTGSAHGHNPSATGGAYGYSTGAGMGEGAASGYYVEQQTQQGLHPYTPYPSSVNHSLQSSSPAPSFPEAIIPTAGGMYAPQPGVSMVSLSPSNSDARSAELGGGAANASYAHTTEGSYMSEARTMGTMSPPPPSGTLQHFSGLPEVQ